MVFRLSCFGGKWSISSSIKLKSPRRKSSFGRSRVSLCFLTSSQKSQFLLLLLGAYMFIKVVVFSFHLIFITIALPLISFIISVFTGFIGLQFIMKLTLAEDLGMCSVLELCVIILFLYILCRDWISS